MQPEQIIQEALDEIQVQHDIEILFAAGATPKERK